MVQMIGPFESHQDIFQWIQVATIQQHIGFINHDGGNIGKQINVFGIDTPMPLLLVC